MTGWKSPKRTNTLSFRSIRWGLWLGAAIGGAAAVMLVLAGLLPLRLIFGIEFAPEQVADYIIENSNPNIALTLQSALGAFSLPSAVLGGIMFVAGLGMIVGVLYRWIYKYSRPAAIILACAAAPLLVRTVFPNVTQTASMPLLLTGFALDWLLRNDLYHGRVNLARRQFLERIGLYSLGGIALTAIYAVPTILSESSARVLRKFFTFVPPSPRQTGFDIPGLSPEVTSVADFYKMRKSPTPIPNIPADWRLQIDGLVESPLLITFAELLELPRSDFYLTRQCISNPVGGNLISTALMSGVPLKLLLEKAGVLPAATEIVFYGRDGYSENINLEYGLEHGMITYAMNGEGLPEAHGAPARVEMIGMYGFKSLKWLDRIEIVSVHAPAIWEQQGFTTTPLVKTMSRIDVVNWNEAHTSLQIAGIAFAGTRAISRVEVQVNDGDWQEAILHAPALSDITWVQWRTDAAVSGEATVTVRAVDGQGQPQIETVQPQKPDGASGLHQTKVTT
ncbi:MAG: molybdopterin-dependent oxidoreductase [Anaerolineae bacterium]|nr:molybdopterin-dependent oxidoreductase [Anaerolineae bacterium]